MADNSRMTGAREQVHGSDPLAHTHPLAEALREESSRMAEQRLRALMEKSR